MNKFLGQFKPEYTKLDTETITNMAYLMTYGEKKHDNLERNNVSIEEIYNKIFRHLFEARSGVKEDKESGMHPLIHLMCDAMIIIETERKNND